MDRRVPAERWPGHAVEQLGRDGWKIAQGDNGPVAMCRMSACCRQVSDRIEIHFHPSGILVVPGFGYVFTFNFIIIV